MTPKQKNRPEEGRQAPAPVPAPARPTDPTEACIADAQAHLRSGMDTLESDTVTAMIFQDSTGGVVFPKTPADKQGIESAYRMTFHEKDAQKTVAFQERSTARSVAFQERSTARSAAIQEKSHAEKPILADREAELQALDNEIRTTRYPDTAAYDRAKAELPWKKDAVMKRYQPQLKQIESINDAHLKQIEDINDARLKQIEDTYDARLKQIENTFDTDPRVQAWRYEETQPWYIKAEWEANEKNHTLRQIMQERDGAVAQCRRSVGELQTALTTDLTTAAEKVQKDIETTGKMDVAKRWLRGTLGLDHITVASDRQTFKGIFSSYGIMTVITGSVSEKTKKPEFRIQGIEGDPEVKFYGAEDAEEHSQLVLHEINKIHMYIAYTKAQPGEGGVFRVNAKKDIIYINTTGKEFTWLKDQVFRDNNAVVDYLNTHMQRAQF